MDKGQVRAINLAEPCMDGLFEIVPAPLYPSVEANYRHVTLRATKNLPKGISVLKETPVSYVPLIEFSSRACPTKYDTSKLCQTEEFSVAPLPQEEVLKCAQDKDKFFTQGWPTVSPYLSGCRDTEVLQLVCSLILKHPEVALEYGAEIAVYPTNLHTPADCLPFSTFKLAMHTLVLLGCPKKNVRPWLKFEDFKRLYARVYSNHLPCTTLGMFFSSSSFFVCFAGLKVLFL